MGKAKRSTRKELEEVITKLIHEVEELQRYFMGMNNCVAAYIKFKGDTLTFGDFMKKEISEMEKARTQQDKDVKSDKKDRYKNIATPL